MYIAWACLLNEMCTCPQVYSLGKPGLSFKSYLEKSGENWVIKYFKCSELWILRQVRLDNKNKLFLHRTNVH